MPATGPPRLAAAVAALAALRLTGHKVGLALVYHRIADRVGDGRFELNPAIAADAFRRQVSLLTRLFDLVPASALPTAAGARTRGGSIPLAITFDDDLPEHATVAAPVLRAHAAAATFFLCGSFAEGGFFWWEDLQAVVDARAMAPADLPALPREDVVAAVERRPRAIHRLARTIEGLDPEKRAAVAATLRERAAPHRGGEARLDEGAVRELAASFEIGFHTLRHDVLTQLDHDSLARGLRDGRDRLERIAAPLRAVSYPHGKADARVARAARLAGFEVGYTGVHRAFAAGGDPLLIGRVQPRAGQGLSGFAWTLAQTVLAR